MGKEEKIDESLATTLSYKTTLLGFITAVITLVVLIGNIIILVIGITNLTPQALNIHQDNNYKYLNETISRQENYIKRLEARNDLLFDRINRMTSKDTEQYEKNN